MFGCGGNVTDLRSYSLSYNLYFLNVHHFTNENLAFYPLKSLEGIPQPSLTILAFKNMESKKINK